MERILATFSVIFVAVTSLPTYSSPSTMLFLQKYGYFSESSNRQTGSATVVSNSEVRTALTEFQRFVGLKQTGEMDNATLTKMNSARCGVKDIVGRSNSVRKKRYALQGSQWKKTHITYKISKYSNRIKDPSATRNEISRALEMWSDVSLLTFEERKKGKVDIDIRFEEGEHGDGDPFDGPDKTLAHAFFPEFGGDAHFDDEEEWTFKKKAGTNLFQIAAHEFGHSLGLSHSDNTNAIMNPYPPWQYRPSFKLHPDDIKAIQTIYGSRESKMQKISNTDGKTDDSNDFTPNGAPDLCRNISIDTVTQTKDGSTYFFKGDFYWKVRNTGGIEKGYPKKISKDWSGLPGNLDASVTRQNGKTFFFKGKRYWKFTNQVMEEGYPKLISDKFQGIPVKPDAAMECSSNGKIYFFKGAKYWCYDDNEKPAVGKKYPKSIKEWKGVPNNIDAAFTWKNHKMYFFKGNTYYQFSYLKFEVDSGDPPYPRLTSKWWFGC